MDRGARSTSPWEYIDFELEIHKGSRRKYTVCARSPEGEAQEEMRFPFDKGELKDKLKDLETAVLRSGRKRRRIRTPEVQAVQNFGQKLFQALLSGEIRAHYDLSLRQAKRQNKGLRLKLRIQPAELAVLPWEFLYDPGRNSYLCLSSKTPLVRYLELREPVEQLAVSPPLKILGMVASPSDLAPLDVEHEKRRVEEAIKDLQTQGRVELTWLEGQTPRDLQRAMIRGPWHVFHFIGHGDFDPETEEGLIAFANEEGYARLLPAEDLALLLKDHWDLRLVLLNSCEGARGSESDAFSSTAATLVRPGVPAVVAMQYEVTDRAAIEFSRAFYEAVADGLPLDASVAEARTAVSMRSALEWGTPVLYMRSPDGRIFDVQQTVDRPGEKEPKFGRFKTLPGWEPESTTSSSFEKDTSARFVMSEREDEPIRFECSEFQADIPIKHTHMFFVYAKRQDFEPIQIGTHDSVEWWWFKGDFYKVEFEPGHPSADLAAKLAADETYADRTSLLDTLPEEGYAPDEVAEGVFEIKGETETALESAERLDIAKAITLQAVEVSRLNELLAVQDTSHDLGLEKDASARVYVDKSWRRTQVCMESDLHQPRQVLVDDDTVFKLIPELQNYHPILLDKKTDRGRLWRSEVIAEWWCFKGDIYLAKREKSYQSEALSLL